MIQVLSLLYVSRVQCNAVIFMPEKSANTNKGHDIGATSTLLFPGQCDAGANAN